MLIRLLHEKQRSFRDFVHGDDYAGYMVILMCTPLTALGAWKAYPHIFMSLGFFILTIMFIAGAVVTWIEERKSRGLCGIDLSVRAYHKELQQLYERRIRFVKGVKYWFAIPFVIGIFLVLWPVAGLFCRKPWDILLVLAIMALFWLSVWYERDVRGVGRLQGRKTEVDTMLDHMDQT